MALSKMLASFVVSNQDPILTSILPVVLRGHSIVCPLLVADISLIRKVN
jgi:hypothetical protein